MTRSINDPYAHAARSYFKAGWVRPIPAGSRGERRAKWPPPDDYTGRNVEPIGKAEILAWERTHGVNNLALHMFDGVIGIDVDAYDKKHGDLTIKQLEAFIGELPPTARSTSRGADNPSGIRFYRVPAGVEFHGKVPVINPDGTNARGESGVEIIQPSHRYAVVWPSIHPDTGERYEWFDADGEPLEGPPNVADLPELPAMWVERLRKGAGSYAGGEQADLGREDVLAWLDEHGGPTKPTPGVPCRAVRGVLRTELANLEAAAENGSSRYDAAVEGVWALVQLAVEGHLGARNAVYQFGKAYREAVRDEPNRDPSEWQRMVTGAVEKAWPMTLSVKHAPGDCPERDPKTWPAPTAPLDVARRYVAEHHTVKGGLVTLRFWRDEFYRYNGRHYEPVSETSLLAELGALLHDVEYVGAATTTTSILRWNPTPTKLKAVIGMLPSVPGVMRPDTADSEDSNPATIAMANGLLDVATRSLTELTPAYFTLHCLPYGYDPDAQCPEWEAFLESVWSEHEGDAVDLLQEWFGYVLSGRTELHKMMMLLGPTRSGKGTITRVLEALVGAAGTAAITFDGFGQNFGLQAAIGKTLITLPDARFDGRNQGAVVERLLSISGGDSIVADRKGKEPWMGRLSARIMAVSNELPMLRESSGALMARFVGPLRMSTSFLGREDYGLEDRLLRELAGIFVWSLDGLDALDEQGSQFTMPRMSQTARQQWVGLNSPVEAFLLECARMDDDAWTATDEIYDAYHSWALDEGSKPMQKSRFMRDLMAARTELRPTRKVVDGERVRGLAGIRVKLPK